MASLVELAQWGIEEDEIYQLELEDFITGGVDGNDNLPHLVLANRTRWLREKFNAYSKTVDSVSEAITVKFTEALFPSVAEDSGLGNITCMIDPLVDFFHIQGNKIIFDRAGIYRVDYSVLSHASYLGVGGARIIIRDMRGRERASHMNITTDQWYLAYTFISISAQVNDFIEIKYDSAQVHVWGDDRFSKIEVTRLGETNG